MNVRQWAQIRDWVLLVGLLGVSTLVMLTQNTSILRALRAASLELTARVETNMSWVGRYVRALEENDALRRENIQLSSQLARSREAQQENERLRRLLEFRQESAHRLAPARIVEKEITRQRNFLTLNVGREQGVEVGMGVVDDRGILGKVELVSEHYARVMSYLNMDFRVPAKLQSSNAMGIVRWEGQLRDQLLMEHVIKTEQVEVGDLVVSSGFSGVFPPGYPIGVVESYERQPGKNQLLIYLRPASSIDTGDHAFVVLETPDPERTAIEQLE
ncbi:MAG: rod shape-determining protein MreC [Rhodothermales bacterium]